MWQRAMAYWQSDSVILSKPIILLFFLNSSYSCSSKNFFWNRYFICGRCFCRCWINCWYWFQCFNQPKLFFVSTFLQKFAFKVFNAYHRWRRGLAVFSNDKVYPTIFWYLHHLRMKTQGLFSLLYNSNDIQQRNTY